jgi:hypothetical protein
LWICRLLARVIGYRPKLRFKPGQDKHVHLKFSLSQKKKELSTQLLGFKLEKSINVWHRLLEFVHKLISSEYF